MHLYVIIFALRYEHFIYGIEEMACCEFGFLFCVIYKFYTQF